MPKVLISDKMDPIAAEIFSQKGVEVDVKPGMSVEELSACIGAYDGLAIRSSTTVTADILKAATNLKVVGRAGIGVDNVDIPSATAQGVVIMNTPFGNSITTAEHALSMMMALARQIPQANESTQASKWEKSKFMGVELYGKTLGVIGCGNIGAIVISRAKGLQMRVVGYDPFLSDERAAEMGIEKMELDALFQQSDFITLHVPKNEHTSNIINADAITKMKDGVRIINCARGGLIDEAALKDGLDSGKVAGAALDVFAVEPAKDNPLFGHPNLICTPHLGASTSEAQVNVAVQVAEQMADYLVNGAVQNALNMASISADDAPLLRPYMALSEQLGRFAGQITDQPIKRFTIRYDGTVASLNTKPLSAIIVANALKDMMDSVNMVNAITRANDQGISIDEISNDQSKDWKSAISLTIETEDGATCSLSGALFTGKEPRLVELEGVRIEAAITPHMLFIRNQDAPGMIGDVGKVLGDANINIADFRLGRTAPGEQAICLIAVDDAPANTVLEQAAKLPQVQSIKALRF